MSTARAARRIGILGRGQLAQMLAEAGEPLGQVFEFVGEAGARFQTGVDVVTFESECWSLRDVEHAAAGIPVCPAPRTLEIGQDRRLEKSLFDRLGFATARWVPVEGRDQLAGAVEGCGLPAVLKLRRGGYDGRGQWLIHTRADVARVADELGGRAAILESFVSFQRELSIVAARGADGSVVSYPLAQNFHEHGCLRLTLAPARIDERVLHDARTMARTLLEELDYVGVLALEMFEVANPGGRTVLYANEIAPRVHNSGHWTIEGAATSQFENHLRAISGLPLGDTSARGPCAMVNLLGTLPPARDVQCVGGAHFHDYGKSPSPGRKLGHVTVCAADDVELRQRLSELCERIGVELPAAATRWMHSNSFGSI